MKNFNLLILLSVFISVGCTDSDSILIDEPESYISNDASFTRLNFEDERSLEEAILAGEMSDIVMLKSSGNRQFVSMLSVMPRLKGSSEVGVSYYEGLGFDTLVPNLNFAALLTPDGELEVGNEVIRITPAGTFRFLKDQEEGFHKFIEENPDFNLSNYDSDIYIVSDNIILYNTFREKPEDYELIFEGEFEPLVGYEEDDEEDFYDSQLKSSSEPDFDTFAVFRADRKTVVGKAIESLIGSKINHTLEFYSKRRLRGSFYNYDYGVYSEIGVTGATQKKNWIGWSNTKSDELRVGWRKICIKRKIPDFQANELKRLNDNIYYPPQYVIIEGKLVAVATIVIPEIKPSFYNEMLSHGTKAAFDFLEKKLVPKTQWEKAEAFIIASRTEIWFFPPEQNVTKYNVERYAHVFAKYWLDFQAGYNSEKGFFINGINQENYEKPATYLKAIGDSFNSRKGTLEGGEVYVCGRFGNTWRGMKIVKKFDKKDE